MKIHRHSQRECGLTFIEVLLILVVAFIFAGLFLTPTPRAREKGKRIQCISNLKQGVVAFRIWANDHGDEFPWQVPSAQGGSKEFLGMGQVFGHFLVASNEFATPRILACPSDSKRSPTVSWTTFSDSHLSYFVGLDTDTALPESILLGDRSISTNGTLRSGLLLISANQQISWAPDLHHYAGNVALLDGSAQQLSRIAFSNAFRVLIP